MGKAKSAAVKIFNIIERPTQITAMIEQPDSVKPDPNNF
jgi:hypothetical protein